MIHCYIGNGKGKTTAAVGLAVRARGRGKRVKFCRFLKQESGEVESLRALGVEIGQVPEVRGFFGELCAEEQERVRAEQREAFRRALEDRFDLIVLDEVLWLVSLGILPGEELARAAREFPGELVLTGGSVPEGFPADYVTEMRKVRHPFDRGVTAREGIEY